MVYQLPQTLDVPKTEAKFIVADSFAMIFSPLMSRTYDLGVVQGTPMRQKLPNEQMLQETQKNKDFRKKYLPLSVKVSIF